MKRKLVLSTLFPSCSRYRTHSSSLGLDNWPLPTKDCSLCDLGPQLFFLLFAANERITCLAAHGYSFTPCLETYFVMFTHKLPTKDYLLANSALYRSKRYVR
ncbi:hypothetical protein ARMGADRAFT_526449 [Armillaria gallica]|uniref:Uncharacterized protein n=1 Tax=Armillaria gallica TaxID=47427 RepID=A0A2H3ELT4_ARMGA|nr:hypothetical protein ARMGADRAFT_526449 [Armillaria gallica]